MNDDVNRSETPFEFHGKGGEYFKIWIVNLLLTIVTLGIYSAWATVRKRRYFYGNTQLEGTSFEYMATPWMILKGRLIAIGLFVLYTILTQYYVAAAIGLAILLAFVAPWIIWNSMRFNARMSAFRNVRFSFGGRPGPVYIYILLIPAIPIAIAAILGAALYFFAQVEINSLIALGSVGLLGSYLLFPLSQAKLSNYYVNNVAFGQGRFGGEITPGLFYKTYGIAFLVSMAILIGVGVLIALGIGGFNPSAQAPEHLIGFIIGFYLLIIPFSFWLRAYVGARIRNYVLSNTRLDNRIQLKSNMNVWGLFMLYLTNTLLIIITLGFAYPWTAVRLARFKASKTSALINGDLSGYVTEQMAYQSSIGDELGDAFDLDMDIAL